jgi:hypothetical protein
MASSGLVTITIMLSGATREMFSQTSRITFALVITRSSRVIPGFRAMPEVTTTTSDPRTSS